ncbi:MAG: DsbC family protein [Syntrophales bacterium]
MNIAKRVVFTLCVLMVVAASAPLQAATPEESFRKNFPSLPLESMTPTDIPGVYEVVSGGRIAYYVPAQEYLIVGEIVNKDKKNLTRARSAELLAKRLKDLPLEKALKIGSGPHTVIEITDPDCPFCRKASEFLAARKDVTQYIFLFPLSMHKDAEKKIDYIFCAKDQAKAYEEAMAGKLDDMKFKVCDNAEAAELAKAHKEIGGKIGVESLGTPLFLVNGQFVQGANMPQIEKILGPQK